MLTRPKLMVPDQNGRADLAASSLTGPSVPTSSSAVSGNGFPLLPLNDFQARGKTLCQRCGRLFSRDDLQPWPFAARLLLNELHDPVAILVAKILRPELSFERGNELLRHLEL